MFLVIFTAINGNDHVHVNGGTVRFAQYYVPAIVSFGLISACYTNLAFTLCIRRENGILKRTRGTPLSPVDYLAGLVVNVLVVAAILTVLTILLGVIAYHVTFPSRYIGLLVTIAVAAFCFGAIGVLVSTFVPNEDAAPAIINFLLFPLLFISGTFGTIANNSSARAHRGSVPGPPPAAADGQRLQPVRLRNRTRPRRHLVVLSAWGLGALIVALHRFRWEPHAG